MSVVVESFKIMATCVLAFDMGRRLFNLRAGVIAGVLCALSPTLLRYVPDYHLETLFTFLLTLTVWSSLRFYESPTLRRATLFGIVAGLAALTKAVAMVY